MKEYMSKLRAMKGKKNKVKGDGFFTDAYDYLKKGASYIKDNKLISKALSTGAILAPEFSEILGPASALAASLGLGKKKNKKKLMIM